jgi:hypothetical protein
MPSWVIKKVGNSCTRRKREPVILGETTSVSVIYLHATSLAGASWIAIGPHFACSSTRGMFSSIKQVVLAALREDGDSLEAGWVPGPRASLSLRRSRVLHLSCRSLTGGSVSVVYPPGAPYTTDNGYG